MNTTMGAGPGSGPAGGSRSDTAQATEPTERSDVEVAQIARALPGDHCTAGLATSSVSACPDPVGWRQGRGRGGCFAVAGHQPHTAHRCCTPIGMAMDRCAKPGCLGTHQSAAPPDPFGQTHLPRKNTQAQWKRMVPARMGLHQRAPDTARKNKRLRSRLSWIRSAANTLLLGLSALTYGQVPDDHGIVRRE